MSWLNIKHIFLFGLLISSCGKPKIALEEEKLMLTPSVNIDFADILERNELRVAVDYSATTYFLYKGHPIGFEYDLLKKFAKNMGVSLKIIVQPSIKESFSMLQRGEIDLIAYPLAITPSRKEQVEFTTHYRTVRQMLIQRKPDGWRKINPHQMNKILIRNQVDLLGKEVHVLNASSYLETLESLEKQIGGDIIIIEDSASVESDEMIRRVATGQYEYTVADENLAQANTFYYPNIDFQTPVSFPTRIAWAVRKSSPLLLDSLNRNIKKVKKSGLVNILYKKYFLSSRNSKIVAKEDYTSHEGKKDLSPYDEIIKENAKRVDWDWLLLASMVMQESQFDPKAKSWAGAQGLLQLMPATAASLGVKNRNSPEQSLKGGTDYLIKLEKRWMSNMEDTTDIAAFVMASYNAGPGHVIDARALVTKYGGERDRWEDVSKYLVLLSTKKYYTDDVVKLGYCRGQEPVNYVKQINERYQIYKDLVK
ncbi:MAG: transporter substrate-binding domain-containing protein [Cyclobacteriaceae bacterium]|nr:transporter substrate-binding domain-containing protein [Cyclobacteriaceae bacterium]